MYAQTRVKKYLTTIFPYYSTTNPRPSTQLLYFTTVKPLPYYNSTTCSTTPLLNSHNTAALLMNKTSSLIHH